MKILGIETSCDETAAAVVENGNKLLSNVVASSIDMHKQYGGVVPEIAARSHIESINPVIKKAMSEAGCSWKDIDGIAVTYGPGLGGSLLVGVLTARTLAILHKKPLYAINHVEAHVYASFITKVSGKLSDNYQAEPDSPSFPMLALIVSGGHTQLVLFEDHFKYKVLGVKADDAVGEAFDKVAKMLGLPYPGGPSVEKLANEGNSGKYPLPKSRLDSKYDFSYSGLKTAVLRTAQNEINEDFNFPSHQLKNRLNGVQKADLAASFCRVAIETLVDKTMSAYEEYAPESIVVAGGVSASPELRRQLADKVPVKVHFPDVALCTDNGAMVATLGFFKAEDGAEADPQSLDIKPSLSM